MKLGTNPRSNIVLPIESPGRCPDCGTLTLAYLGDPLAPHGLWKCACGWRQLGKAPRQGFDGNKKHARDANITVLEPKAPYQAPTAVPVPVPRSYARDFPITDMGAPDGKDHRPTPIARIVKAACDRMGIVVAELNKISEYENGDRRGVCRHPRYTLARELIVTLARELTRMSFPEIAPYIGTIETNGGHNHSTAITSHKRFQKKLDWTMAGRLGPTDAERLGCPDKTCREMLDELRRELVR